MIKLVKKQSTQWNGNGFGSNTAEWVVKGQENIALRQSGYQWLALDTNEYAFVNGIKRNKIIARANTRKKLVEVLSNKLTMEAN